MTENKDIIGITFRFFFFQLKNAENIDSQSDFKELEHLKWELCIGVDGIVIVLSVNVFIVRVFSVNPLLSIFTTK